MNVRSAGSGTESPTSRSGEMPPPPKTLRPASVLKTGRRSGRSSMGSGSESALRTTRLMLRPDGVNQRAVVSFSPPPPSSSNTFWALPLPYDRRPSTAARS